MVSENFRYKRPNGSPRININPEESQPLDLFEPERTLEQPSLRERVNEILLPDDDVIPDMTQIDMGNDPCCAEAKEMWLNELRPILGVPEGQEYDIPPGGY